VQAGAVVFFNGYLLHRSKKNRSRQYRRALVNHYMNAWSRLPWCQEQAIGKGETHVAKADNRCIVPVSGADPYAADGYVTTSQGVWLRGYDKAGATPELEPGAPSAGHQGG
jgi:phytanoyl-CoA hydroxylase